MGEHNWTPAVTSSGRPCMFRSEVEEVVGALEADNTTLRTELQYAWTCPHGNDYRDRSCLVCWGDGSEDMLSCEECGADTWHRGGVCLRHDKKNAPGPYTALRKRVEGLEELRKAIGDGGDLETAADLLRLATNEHGVDQSYGRDPYAISARLNQMSNAAWKLEEALAAEEEA